MFPRLGVLGALTEVPRGILKRPSERRMDRSLLGRIGDVVGVKWAVLAKGDALTDIIFD